MNLDTKQMYDMGINNLLKGIADSYANWNKAADSPNSDRVRNRVDEFRNRLKINPGRKFDKVIEKNRVWGFVAKTDGVHKGVPYNVGDVFKAVGDKTSDRGVLSLIRILIGFLGQSPNYL